jgi:sugar phosphate isomerase/epimerase
MGIVLDTISEDVEHALSRVSEWGIPNVELFSLWGKNVCDLTPVEASAAAALIERHRLRVTNIASLIMRCEPNKDAERRDLALFERAVEMGRRFGTDRIRCYAYLKQPSLETIWPRLLRTYDTLIGLAVAHDVTLLLENSSYANLQHAVELSRFLDAVDHPRLKLLWDAGNAFAAGDPTPAVEAWHMLKDRIVHLHLKDTKAHGSKEWVPVGTGALDLSGLLKAVKSDGYAGVISLEPYFDKDDAAREDKVRTSVERLCHAMHTTGLT